MGNKYRCKRPEYTPPPSSYTRVDSGGSQNLPRGRIWETPESTPASQNLPTQGYSLESTPIDFVHLLSYW